MASQPPANYVLKTDHGKLVARATDSFLEMRDGTLVEHRYTVETPGGNVVSRSMAGGTTAEEVMAKLVAARSTAAPEPKPARPGPAPNGDLPSEDNKPAAAPAFGVAAQEHGDVLAGLDDRERRIFAARRHPDGSLRDDAVTMATLGMEFDLSVSRISQLDQRALEHVRAARAAALNGVDSG